MLVAESERIIPYRDATPGNVFSTRLPGVVQPIAPETDTLSKHFLLRVKQLGDEVAQRKKRFGIWQEYTWNDVYEHVVDFGMGLLELGLQPCDTLLIIGENDPRNVLVAGSRHMDCIARPAAYSAMPALKTFSM